MVAKETKLLTGKATAQKIKRIAHEVLEENFQEEEIIIAGIQENGYRFGELLKEELQAIAKFKVSIVSVTLDKDDPLGGEISLDKDASAFDGKVIILTDDVLNTGRTLAYSLRAFLNTPMKRMQTAVIVDRGHKNFPISADYIGYSLSTTIAEHIVVVLEGEDSGVYLH